MDSGPLRVAQLCESLEAALHAEAKVAPVNDVELAGALYMFLSRIKKGAPESWPQISKTVLLTIGED